MTNLNGMKIIRLFLNLLLSISLISSLAGCNVITTKPDANTNETDTRTEEVDLISLRQQADTAYSNNELNTSAVLYEKLIRRVPEEPEHWFRLANIYVRTNRPQEAIDLYREALVRDPKFSKAWYNLSIVQLKQTAYNLNEMLIYTNEDDALYEKAKNLLDGIQEIIQQE